MKKLLLHICCGPCLIVPFEKLKNEYDITALWYNPYIQPLKEQWKRLEAVKVYQDYRKIKVIYQTRYDLESFFQKTVFREADRCVFCYEERLRMTAHIAKKGKFDCFSTTLLQSHQQDLDTIMDLARNLERKTKVGFLKFDFRKDWKKGVEISRELEMYRQQYCGCIYSEKERYMNQFNKFRTDLNNKYF